MSNERDQRGNSDKYKIPTFPKIEVGTPIHTFSVETTVSPSPGAASDYVRNWKEQREAEQQSGTVFESERHQRKEMYSPHWVKLSRDEVWDGAVKDTIWGQPTHYQGVDFEQVRNVNLGSNCPHIDDIVVDAMTVTQHKSMDLTSKSYQDVRQIDSTVSGYIDHLDERTQTKWEWTNKKTGQNYEFERGVNFQDRYLELGIPLGKATQEQVDKLIELQEYAQTKDVTLVIVEVP